MQLSKGEKVLDRRKALEDGLARKKEKKLIKKELLEMLKKTGPSVKIQDVPKRDVIDV